MTKKITNPEILAVHAAAALDPARGRVWVGLDVGLKSTAVCVLDGEGKVLKEFGGYQEGGAKAFIEALKKLKA